MNSKNICLTALGIGSKYRKLASLLAQDLIKLAVDNPFIILIDQPQDFIKLKNVIPIWLVEKVLAIISEPEIFLAEARHGAIIADAFRVPWIPILTNYLILKFKWQDWCASLKLNYQPAYIKRLLQPKEKRDLFTPVRLIRDKFRQNNAAKELI